MGVPASDCCTVSGKKTNRMKEIKIFKAKEKERQTETSIRDGKKYNKEK